MSDKKSLGLWTSASLVVGNTIGAGVFMMPAILAAYGGISILGWIFSAAGAFFLAILFSRLSKMLPGLQGGPYAYTRRGLGDMPAFLVAWGYWVSFWAASAALAIALVGYLSVIFPILGESKILSVGTGLLSIWGLTWYNAQGVSKVGILAMITTVLKLVPIFAIGIVGLFYINLDHFIPFNLSGENSWMAILATTSLTLFAFLGIESATVPAESIKNPEKNVPRATMMGTFIVSIVYILSSVSIMGLVSPAELSNSSAPFADAAVLLWGQEARYLVAGAASISVFGALNGFCFMQGQIPEAVARDGLFPPAFKKENKNGAPYISLIFSSAIVSLLILMNLSGGMLKLFEIMMLISTVTNLVPYLLSGFAYIILIRKFKLVKVKNQNYLVFAILTILFVVFGLIGSGAESLLWGLVFLIFGIPFYFYGKMQKSKAK